MPNNKNYLDKEGLTLVWAKIKNYALAKNQGQAGANKVLYTDNSGNILTRPMVDGFTIVNALPESNINDNTIYLIPSSTDSGGDQEEKITSDFNKLSNKPQINSVELTGNKSAAQLHLVGESDVLEDWEIDQIIYGGL